MSVSTFLASVGLLFACALGLQEPPPKSVEQLRQELKAKEAGVRRDAAKALGQRGQADAAPDLLPLLKDADSEVRLNAALALARIGPAAQAGVRTLADLTKDQDSSVRAGAFAALGALDAPAAAALPAYRAGLADGTALVRQAAAFAVASLGPGAKPVAPTLVALLKDEHPDVRIAAVFALGRLGEEGKPIVPNLKALKDDRDPYLKLEAAAALWSLTRAPEHLKEIEAAVRQREPRLREVGQARLAACVRQLLTGDLKPAVALLKQSNSTAVKRTLVEGFAELPATRCGELAPALIELLDDAPLREATYKALAKAGAAAVPALQKELKAERDVMRREAATVLGKLGAPTALPALPGLIAALKDKDDDVRQAAAEALGQLGPAAKEALPALKAAQNDENKRVKEKAAAAVAAVEGKAR